jgi:5S rRNA maturation endonuclease (ribonuclease M5)
VLEGRLNKRSDATEFEKYNVKTQGSIKGYFWHVQDDPSSTRLVIAEGPKDGISAWQIGYKNFLAVLGATNWQRPTAEWIAEQGYTEVIVFGHADPAGEKLIENATKDLHSVGVTPLRIQWPNTVKEGYDLTDALIEHSLGGAGIWLQEHIQRSRGSRGWFADFRTHDPSYVAPKPDVAVPLEQVRAELPAVLQDFVQNYDVRLKSSKQGVVKVLAAPPGSGKSYAMVELAQNEARKALLKGQGTRTELDKLRADVEDELREAIDIEEIDGLKLQLDKLNNKINNLSVARVLFASPFVSAWEDVQAQPNFDKSLWYNFKARDEETCTNLPIATGLAEKGYSVMKYCETGCPMQEDCESRIAGYLMQRKLVRTRPITFVRHANLISLDFVQNYDVILIDENFLNVFADFVEISDLRPSTQRWREWLSQSEEEAADDLEKLATAIKGLASLDDELHGKDCLDRLNILLGGRLVEIIQDMPKQVIEKYQPLLAPSGIAPGDLPFCVLPTLYAALEDEIEDYAKGTYYNSRIRLKENKLSVSTLFPVKLPRNRKIIVADGTAMPELYGLFFGRDVEVYQPELYNENGRVVQLTGTDMSRSLLAKEIGLWAYNTMAEPGEVPRIEDVFGSELDTDRIPFTEDMYASNSLYSLLQVLKAVLENHSYKKVLFVTYKRLQTAMELRLQHLADQDPAYKKILKKMSFGHYGGLRGTNKYQDYDAVFLAGCPRQPYNDLHAVISAWARLKSYPQYIPNLLGYKPAPYHGVNMYMGTAYITFEDAFAQDFVDMIEAGEVRQCLDRIRLYTGGNKTAFLYMSRPTARWVGEVTSSRHMYRQIMQPQVDSVETFIKQTVEQFGAPPSMAALVKGYNLPRRKAQEYLSSALTNVSA